MKKSSRWYSIVSYFLLIFAFAFFAAAQWLTSLEVAADGRFSLITGRPRVVISNDLLEMTFADPVHLVQLTFRHEFNSEYVTNLDRTSRAYDILFDPDSKKSIRVESTTIAESGGFDHVLLRAGRAFSSPDFREREIVRVIVDDASLTPHQFLNDMLVRRESSFKLYYPMALHNISSELADAVGPYLLGTIQVLLLVLASAQFILLFSSARLGNKIFQGSRQKPCHYAFRQDCK